jgi:hypothetical protein
MPVTREPCQLGERGGVVDLGRVKKRTGEGRGALLGCVEMKRSETRRATLDARAFWELRKLGQRDRFQSWNASSRPYRSEQRE